MGTIVFVSPTGSWNTRETDSYGNGQYGAPRSRVYNNKVIRYTHPGLDLFIKPGKPVLSPVVGDVFRHIRCYSTGVGADYYTGLSINATWCRVELLYVGFNPDAMPVGKALDVGEEIGVAQDLRTRYPKRGDREPITPHIHIEFVRIDPSAVWAAVRVINQALALATDLRKV
jgi:hypothetical protein